MKKLAINGGPKTISKKFDLGATYFKEEMDAVVNVIKSNTISGFVANDGPKFYGGEKVKELELLFTKYFNIQYAVASNSATSSLHSALVAIGVQPGDEVIVPAVSMSATASSIVMTGAKPVFIDINDGRCTDCNCIISDMSNKGCFNINVNLIEQKINKKTKAIMVVHLFGKSADMDSIVELSHKYNLKIIEDCAQAPGAIYNGIKVGSIGDIGIFSFNQSKTISAGEGGVAITRNKKYALRMQLMRNHAEAMIESFPESKSLNLIGYNYRITDLEAAVAVEQFKRLDKFNDRKIKLANRLTKLLSNVEGIITIPNIINYENVLFIYPLLIDEKKIKCSREYFVKACNAEGVPMTNGYTKPLVDLPLFNQNIKDDKFSNSKKLHSKKLVSLKICHHYNVSIDDIDLCADAIEKVITELQSS
tara:strand:- start:2946 stop:4208 length:1263 start_codon:yes stop_codon:yes gene_type:complete